jgi:hypothetical protein
MEQLTLWEPEQTANLAVNPVWKQLDLGVKKDAVTKLSLVMVKAVNPNRNDVENTQEDNHDQ